MAKKAERKVVAYIRVSKEEQKKSGLSIQYQTEQIEAYAKFCGLSLSEVRKDEAFSGGTLSRPAVEGLLDDVRKGLVSHVIILKLDRLTRSIRDLLGIIDLFEKHDVSLSSVSEKLDTSNASGRLVVHMLGIVAEWERGTISERVEAALSVKRSRREKLGGIVPFGYQVVGDGEREKKKLTPNPDEQPVLRGILEARGEGRGYAEIAQGLNQMGIRPRVGKAWYASTIRNICLREASASNPDPGNT